MPASSPSPFDQATYQVRLDWGIDALERLAPADVVVVVDVLRFSTTVTDAVAHDMLVPLDSPELAPSINGAPIAHAVADSGALVMLGCLRNASATAAAIAATQEARGARTSVAIVAAGERDPAAPGTAIRFAVEDQLGAGAIIDALGRLGIDHTSPDAAVAAEGFRALRGAARHLLTASGSGRELAARLSREQVAHAAAIDAATTVPVLVDGVFRAF